MTELELIMSKNEQSRVKIVYLCARLSPYHFASLNSATNYAEIIVLEYSSIDQTYAWDIIEEPSLFRRVTLFRDKHIDEQPVKTVIRRMWTVLDELQPQVVAIMGWHRSAALIALWWCLESKTPTIMMSDSQKHDHPRTWWKELIKKRIIRLTAAGFVGGTNHIEYLKALGIAEDVIMTGCDVVDNNHFESQAHVARQNSAFLIKQYSLPEKYFLASGRFIQEKNLINVIRAYSQYLQVSHEIPWKLVLLGDGPLSNQIMALRAELGLDEMILLPGFIQYKELPVYYGLAQAFILASTSEPWGLVVNEAMASGLPVIVSSRCGCAPDLVKHGQNGFIFDPNDVRALSHYLTYISGKESPRDVMGRSSQRIIYDWNLDMFARNLSRAADLALKAPEKSFNACTKAFMWSLIHSYSFKGGGIKV